MFRAAACKLVDVALINHVNLLQSYTCITIRVVSLVWRCQLGLAPAYLTDLCRPVSGAQGSRSLRSAERGVLVVPFTRTASVQNRAFSEAGPRA